MKNIIVLDLDGTILDIKQKYCEVFINITKLSRTQSEIFWNRKREMESSFTIAKDLSNGLKMTSTEYDKLWIEEVEKKEYLALDIPYHGVINKLQELRQDYVLVLCTKRRNVENLYCQLGNLELLNKFDKIMVLNPVENKISRVLTEIFPRVEMTLISDTPGDFEVNDPKHFVTKIGVCSGLTSRDAWNAFSEVSVIKNLTDF